MTDQPTEPIPVHQAGNVGRPIHDRARVWAERYWPYATGSKLERGTITQAAAAGYAQGWKDRGEGADFRRAVADFTPLAYAEGWKARNERDQDQPVSSDSDPYDDLPAEDLTRLQASLAEATADPLSVRNQSGGAIRYVGGTDQERLVTAVMEAHRQSGQPVRVEYQRFASRFTITIGDTGAVG